MFGNCVSSLVGTNMGFVRYGKPSFLLLCYVLSSQYHIKFVSSIINIEYFSLCISCQSHLYHSFFVQNYSQNDQKLFLAPSIKFCDRHVFSLNEMARKFGRQINLWSRFWQSFLKVTNYFRNRKYVISDRNVGSLIPFLVVYYT